MFSATRSMLSDPESKVLVTGAASMVAVGTVVYMYLEEWSVVDALYFSVVALATVGFGDLHPTTDVSKLFTVVYIITGLSILGAFVAELGKHRTADRLRRVHGDPTTEEDG